MKKQIFIMMGLCFTLLLGYYLNTERVALDTYNVNTVTVAHGDTLWSIASRTASADIDIREMVYAVKELNHLENGSTLHPGMELKVPTIKKISPSIADYKLAQN